MASKAKKAKKRTGVVQAKQGSTWLLALAYIYAFAPLLLFVLFWLRPIFAVPLGAAIIYGIMLLLRQDTPLGTPERGRQTALVMVAVLGVLCLWVLTSGIGASVSQYPDHIYRNALFKMLVDYDWPVLFQTGGGTRGMVYYIGYWLPAALLAKHTSYAAGFLSQQIWAVLGLFLIWYLVCEKQKKWRLWILFVFLIFGGLDPIGRLITGKVYDQVGNRYEWWATIFNYPSFTTHLFWVFNQAIYAWLLYCLLMRQKNNKSLVLIWCNSLLTCTLPAIGLLPFVVTKAIQNTDASTAPHRVRTAVRGSLSVSNAIGVVLCFFLSAYILSNGAVYIKSSGILGGKVVQAAEVSTHVVSESAGTFSAYPLMTRIWMYLWFVLLEFGLYYILLYRTEKKKAVYWVSLAFLLVCPWIHVGYWIDFCLRASIPALFCLYTLVLDALQTFRERKYYIHLSLLVGMLCISSFTTVDTLVGVMQPMDQLLYDGERATPELVEDAYITEADNFSGSTNAFFFTHLARQNASEE